jgi:hypothetical protein
MTKASQENLPSAIVAQIQLQTKFRYIEDFSVLSNLFQFRIRQEVRRQ